MKNIVKERDSPPSRARTFKHINFNFNDIVYITIFSQ